MVRPLTAAEIRRLAVVTAAVLEALAKYVDTDLEDWSEAALEIAEAALRATDQMAAWPRLTEMT